MLWNNQTNISTNAQWPNAVSLRVRDEWKLPQRCNQDEGQFVKETYHHLVKKANEPDILNKPGMNSKEHTHTHTVSRLLKHMLDYQRGSMVKWLLFASAGIGNERRRLKRCTSRISSASKLCNHQQRCFVHILVKKLSCTASGHLCSQVEGTSEKRMQHDFNQFLAKLIGATAPCHAPRMRPQRAKIWNFWLVNQTC